MFEKVRVVGWVAGATGWVLLMGGCEAPDSASVLGSRLHEGQWSVRGGSEGSAGLQVAGIDVAGPGLSIPQDCEAGDPEEEPFPGHPFFHQVYRATSRDGLTFRTDDVLRVDHASVPEAVRTPGGETRVYFVNGIPGHHGIWAADPDQSDPQGRLGCVHIDGEFLGQAVDPDIVRLSGGIFRLFYFGSRILPDDGASGMMHPMSSAISRDGFHFRDEGVRWVTQGGTDPTAAYLPSGLWLLGVDFGTETRIASSADGYEFTDTGVEVPVTGGPDFHVLADGRVRIYGRVRGGEGGIGSYVSSDEGASWSPEPGLRVADLADRIVADPSVVRLDDGSWEMLYKQQDR